MGVEIEVSVKLVNLFFCIVFWLDITKFYDNEDSFGKSKCTENSKTPFKLLFSTSFLIQPNYWSCQNIVIQVFPSFITPASVGMLKEQC